MKTYLAKISLGIMGLLASVSQAFAQATCTLNGETIPCDQMPDAFWAIGGGLIVAVVILGILGFIFWITMLVRVIKYKSDNQLVWILVIVVLGIVGAIIYYFVEGRTIKQQTLESVPPTAGDTM